MWHICYPLNCIQTKKAITDCIYIGGELWVSFYSSKKLSSTIEKKLKHYEEQLVHMIPHFDPQLLCIKKVQKDIKYESDRDDSDYYDEVDFDSLPPPPPPPSIKSYNEWMELLSTLFEECSGDEEGFERFAEETKHRYSIKTRNDCRKKWNEYFRLRLHYQSVK